MSPRENQVLAELARRLASSVQNDYRGRWCFFAGFAFMLNGVKKKTRDIDVLTKDKAAYEHIFGLLQQMGFHLVSGTSDFSSFKVSSVDQASTTDLGLDLLCMTNPLLRNLDGIWTELEIKNVKGIPLPVLRPTYLILLKILVNSHRQPEDKKKEQDFYDVKRLMAKKRITSAQLTKEGKNLGLESLTREFLDELKSMKM
jgi:hypothetical protein